MSYISVMSKKQLCILHLLVSGSAFIYLFSTYTSVFQHLFLLSLAPLSQTQGSSREGWLATEEQ